MSKAKPLTLSVTRPGPAGSFEEKYHAEIAPGVSIRIFGSYEELHFAVALACSGYARPAGWLEGLPEAARLELGSLLRGYQRPQGPLPEPQRQAGMAVAGDWVEEHGGERDWLELLNAVDQQPFKVSQPFDQTFKVGDVVRCENHYSAPGIGWLVAFGPKRVTVEAAGGNRRPSLYEFIRTNRKGPTPS